MEIEIGNNKREIIFIKHESVLHHFCRSYQCPVAEMLFASLVVATK